MDLAAALTPWVLGVVALAAFVGLALALTRTRGANVAFAVAGVFAVVELVLVAPMVLTTPA